MQVLSLASLALADPGYFGGHGVAHHPGHATSYYHRSPQGLHGYHYYGKREAEAEPSYGSASVYVAQTDSGYGYHPASYSYGYSAYGKERNLSIISLQDGSEIPIQYLLRTIF